jgi:hypothetical protein
MRAAYTSQKSLCNYIRIINGIDTGGDTNKDSIDSNFLMRSYVTLMSLIGDTAVSLSDKIH